MATGAIISTQLANVQSHALAQKHCGYCYVATGDYALWPRGRKKVRNDCVGGIFGSDEFDQTCAPISYV